MEAGKLRAAMWLRALILCGLASVAHADLSPADLARKNEGGHFTGLPLFAYTVDFGLGVGARVYYFWNGYRDDPRFARTPYLHRIFAQVFASTGGVQYHEIDYDAPQVGGSPYRVRGQLVFARNTAANYFGFTDASKELRFPGSPDAFDKYDDYVAAQRGIVGGRAYTKYDQLDGTRPRLVGSIERSLLDNRVRLLGGISLSYARIRDYTGTQVEAVDASGAATTAPMAPTRLREDCDAGRLVGCSGGFDNLLRLGVSYDTRDFEPDPNSGVFVDLEVDLGTRVLGSQYDYVRGLVAARGWWSPFPDHADLVLAGRVLLAGQSAGTPFFTMNVLPFTTGPSSGLGGHRTLRGFRQDRFVGPVMSVANAEVRWTFARATVVRQKFAFILVPFFDVGRAFERFRDLSVHDWRPSFGGALRVTWNLSTVLTFDYGISDEGTGVYVSFSHVF